MNDNLSIYVTYNPGEQSEESTALRLQTISNLYEIDVILPYRVYRFKRDKGLLETQVRIKRSRVVVAFCLNKLSNVMREELKYAIELNKPIIVIYDKNKGKIIRFKNYGNVKEIFLDFSEMDEALHEIAKFLREKLSVGKNVRKSVQKSDSRLNTENDAITALLGVGLGLLTIWGLSKMMSKK